MVRCGTFWLLFLAVEKHDDFELRNRVSVTLRLLAARAKRPTKKVKSSSWGRGLIRQQPDLMSREDLQLLFSAALYLILVSEYILLG